MGLFSRLFGRSTAPQAATSAASDAGGPDIHPSLSEALDALLGGDHERAFALASQALHAGADAQRICALASSALGRHHQAFGHWLALFDLEPSAHNALQLATVSVMCDEVERGEAWLLKFDQLNAEQPEMSPALAHSNFVSALEQAGHGARSLPHLEWLRDAYAALSITDSHYLHMRGLPFFSAFLDRSLPLLRLQLDDAAIAAWYRTCREPLDAEGKAALDAHLRHHGLAH